jgi:alpha-galactosidase
MKSFHFFNVLVLLFVVSPCFSQYAEFAIFSDGVLTLDNGYIQREISVDAGTGRYVSTRLGLGGEDYNFLFGENSSHDFRFSIFDIPLSGMNQWNFIEVDIIEVENEGMGAIVKLKGTGIMSNLELDITYILYPGIAGIRKNLTFINHGDDDMQLESIDVEHLNLNSSTTDTEVYNHYCRNKHIGAYLGDWDDPVMAFHIAKDEKGLVLVNEAPAVLKRMACFQEHNDISAGLTHADQAFPFRKWLKSGESFTTPDVFLLLYEGERSPYTALNFTLPQYIKNYMGLEIFKLEYKPVFVYNTWNPFRTNIEETMIGELVEAAEECGIQEFIIDDGWMVNTYTDRGANDPWWYPEVGDYIIDKTKFPNGLKPIFKDVKKRGMKPGLWLSIGSASASSAVYREHPEWFVRGSNGELANLHSSGNTGLRTACMSTDWTEHISDIILDLVKDHGLTYTKLDFASVTSAYVNDPTISGCYATDHEGHRDHPESLYANYSGLFELFDKLQKEAPDLFIDCTFETQGKLHLIDYAFLKHAEGNWLSNIEEVTPLGALRVRHLAWKRTSVIPAASCVIGNLRLDSEDLEFDFLSLVGTLPIMLGDIREIPEEKRDWMREWSDWLQEKQGIHDYMSYRQDLRGFGEPMEGHWDGWQRINVETQSGGLVGVFRQGSNENKRFVTVEGLSDRKTYEVIDGSTYDTVGVFTGDELRSNGFPVEMDNEYQGKVFEVIIQ